MDQNDWEAPKEQVRVPFDGDPSHDLSLEQAAAMLKIFREDHPFIFTRVWGKSLGVDLAEEPAPTRTRAKTPKS